VPAGEDCGEIVLANETVTGLNEFNESFIDLGESIVRTLTSFSVATWVRVDNIEQPMAFVSQDGGITSNFVLGMAEGAFHFSMFDGMGLNSVSATAPMTVEADRWYHVTGVRDLLTNEIQLYVDGELQGSATFSQDWDSRASTILGGARSRSQRVDLKSGALSGVRFFRGALSEDEVAGIAAENVPE
jgi:hypothetical protein